MESFYVDQKSISTSYLPNNRNNPSIIQVIVDGCHNGASVEYFMTDLRQLYPESKYELWVIIGMGKDKNINVMMDIFQQIADRVILSKSRHFRAMGKTFSLNFYSFYHFFYLMIMITFFFV